MYSIRPYQSYSFRCWFPNNSVQSFFLCMLSQIHFRQNLLSSSLFFCFILIFLSEAWWWCSLHSSSRIVKFMFFLLLIHPTGMSCFHSSSLILSNFDSLRNRSAVWNLSYPLCRSFNNSEDSVLLISSSILSSCQVLIQFLLFSVGMLPKLYHSFSFSILC